ncbi:MAG: 2-oxo acid dehydrogenase subunit E2, partial [Eubacterium sp.]|nr:2-oxo acid dehydrogenase subunit E2 [Candidatus Colimonas fimequi]
MAFVQKQPRKWGDRRDGVWVKDVPGLNKVMTCLFPKRTESEVCLQQDIDVTELLKYIEEKNANNPEYKTTLFHCFVTMVARVVNERPKLNRFIQGARTYERDEITISFVAKRRFTDHSEESLMVYKAKGEHTLADVSKRIVGDVHEMRQKDATDGIDKILDVVGGLPRPLLMGVVKLVRIVDFWGKKPIFLSDGDANYTTVLLSNLGSIKCPSVYHHLNNYGTNSVMIT